MSLTTAKSGKMLMTEGSVWKKIVAFAIPVFIGNLFQQLYNTVDSLIVGNFLDSNALAAVSSAGNLIFLFIGFFNGLFMGAGVVIANYIGARDKKNIQLAVHTTVALGLVSSVILTVLGVTLTPQILKLMNTPDEVMPNSVMYFRVYFAGAVGFVMYNTLVGVLQAAGDSKHPLYFLVVSSVINIILDMLFIAVFHFGVGSAALATVISQLVSVVLCLRLLMRTKEDYRLEIKKIGFNTPILIKILKYGLPSGLQNSIIGFANTIVQSYINIFGEAAMAGQGSYAKIEGFAFLPITSFSMSLTTFIGQNMGAEKYSRVKKGSLFGTLCCITLSELIGVIFFFTAPTLLRAFDSNPEVIAYGCGRMKTVALFYFLLAYSHTMAAIFRGEGKSVVPMVVMLLFWCVVRVSILAVWSSIEQTIQTVNCVYPITWALSSVTFTVYYIFFDPVNKIAKKQKKEEVESC